PDLAVYTRLIGFEARSFRQTQQDAAERDCFDDFGLHARPVVILLVDPDPALHFWEEAGVSSPRLVTGMRQRFEDVLRASVAMVLARDAEIEGVHHLAPGLALLLPLTIPVRNPFLPLRGRLLAPRLGDLAQFLLLLALIFRWQRLVVARDQATVGRAVDECDVICLDFGLGNRAGPVQHPSCPTLAEGVIARSTDILVADVHRSAHDLARLVGGGKG